MFYEEEIVAPEASDAVEEVAEVTEEATEVATPEAE